MLDNKTSSYCNVLNYCALLSGSLAGISLFTLSYITLEVMSDYHIDLSKYFFFSQALAFLFDSICLSILYEKGKQHLINNKTFYYRIAICLLVVADAVFFRFMFEFKDEGIFASRYFAQQLYISAEHILAFLCFSYAAAYFPDVYLFYNSPVKNINSASNNNEYGC